MKLNLFKRSMIFATFFGSCLCIALLVASLGTQHWVDARARRLQNTESEGRINFGLFEGHKELNFGYGWRPHDLSIGAGTHPARRWAWCGTAAQLAVALAASAGAAVLAALASAARHSAQPRPLLLTNCATGCTFAMNVWTLFYTHQRQAQATYVLFCLGAMSVWLTEFFLRLQHNVMSEEDLANTWSSDLTADLGLSFWLVVAACISAFINNVCILIAMSDAPDSDVAAPR